MKRGGGLVQQEEREKKRKDGEGRDSEETSNKD